MIKGNLLVPEPCWWRGGTAETAAMIEGREIAHLVFYDS